MNKIVIVYFSATGNTLMVSHKLKKLLEVDYDVSLVSVEDVDKIRTLDLSDATLGIGFPCYAFEYPKKVFEPLFDYLKTISHPLKIFIFSTYCISPGISIKKMIRKLESLNCSVMTTGGFICPSAGFVSIGDGKEKGLKKLVMNKTIRFDMDFDSKLKTFTNEIRKSYKRINTRIMPYEYLPVIYARWNEKRIFTDYKIDNDRCIKCRRCVDNCPVSNISINDSVTFINPNDCLRCQRCISNCPNDAITLGEMTKNKRRYSDELISHLLIECDMR